MAAKLTKGPNGKHSDRKGEFWLVKTFEKTNLKNVLNHPTMHINWYIILKS